MREADDRCGPEGSLDEESLAEAASWAESASSSRTDRGVVAIVGRPNVGKSTLFNRLVGRRLAIVHDSPGVTRDRIFSDFELLEEDRADLIDTGGLVPGDDPLGLNDQVLLAVEESDVLALVVDGREGLVAADEAVWHELRPFGRKTIVVVNKADTKAAQENYPEFFSLGVDGVVLVSAEHGTGIDQLVEELHELLPPASVGRESQGALPLAVVGRPNVGKSSLVNRLIGESRSLVSEVAGTTRDPIDTLLERSDGGDLLLIDTAGIRRRSQVSGVPEDVAVMMARRQIDRARICLLLVDAEQGVTSGDLAIAGEIWEAGRGVVVVVNKWDLLDDELRADLELGVERLSEILHDPPRVNVSALTGRGVGKILAQVDLAAERLHRKIPTAELNRLLEAALERHQAPSRGGRPLRVLYCTQVAIAPPTFMLFANRVLKRGDSYRRYLENFLRRELDLPGIPIRLVIRRRGREGA